MSRVVRAGRVEDADAVAAVCRATAQAGDPQPPGSPDPDLVTLVYARPYLALEPRTARVLLVDDAIVGYVVGAVDSAAFYDRWQAEFSPLHLPRPVPGDPALLRLLRTPRVALPSGVERFPSHLHINLLAPFRRAGAGRALLEDFLAGVAAAGSPGVHLRVERSNRPARRFYASAGFAVAGDDGDSLVMTLRLLR